MSFLPLLRDLCWHALIFFLFTVLGYFAIAGSLYGLFFSHRLRPEPDSTKGQSTNAENAQARQSALSRSAIRSDIVLSVWSSTIFAICAAVMTSAYLNGNTRLTLDPYQYSAGYNAFSLVLVIFLQDAYFYFTHRLAHHPKLYKWMHRGHHHSKNPTPLTAFAFDPAEAMIQSIYLMGVVCLIPMHISVLCAVVLVMSLGALVHHFSLRMFPATPLGNWLGSWMVGPTHHWFHHRRFTQHYALYFTFWDRLLGTHHDGYEEILSPSSPSVKTASTTTIVETVVESDSCRQEPSLLS